MFGVLNYLVIAWGPKQCQIHNERFFLLFSSLISIGLSDRCSAYDSFNGSKLMLFFFLAHDITTLMKGVA